MKEMREKSKNLINNNNFKVIREKNKENIERRNKQNKIFF